MTLSALIFDVDGTLAETEELHRRAFNEAFLEHGVQQLWPDPHRSWTWNPTVYRRLLATTGGKERIATYLRDHLGIDPGGARAQTIAKLHQAKTRRYVGLVDSGALELRPGIRSLVEDARAAGLATAIATTTSRANVDALISSCFGREAPDLFSAICAGDEVSRKKPAPDVYLLTLERLGLPADVCIAFEDSLNGLMAARAASLDCIVSPSLYTNGEDHSAATLVVPDFSAISLSDLLAMRQPKTGPVGDPGR